MVKFDMNRISENAFENNVKQLAADAIIVDLNSLVANDYNPNRMPDTEMDLLKQCIIKYGFLFPIIVVKEGEKYRIVDGYHRYEILKRMCCDKVSVVVLDIPKSEMVQLTVLMNRIKGLHQVELMSDLVVKLQDLGLEDDEISNNLGMETEEYIRLQQQLGISHAFRKHQYTNTWEDE